MVTKPPQTAYDEAKNHRVRSYKHIYSVGGLIDALAAGHLVPFGFEVPESFESDEVAHTGVLQMPKAGEKFVGGHEVFACGYDLDANVAFCGNSWSDAWGMRLKLSDGVERGGFFTMPLAYDFTSTFVIGSTFPVATTYFARSPFSTVASFEGSICRFGRRAAPMLNTAPTSTTPTIPRTIQRRLR